MAEFNFANSDPSNHALAALAGNELLVRALGIRLLVVELRGTKNAPTEGAFGLETDPSMKIFVYEPRSKTEYFSLVGDDFQNNILTQNEMRGVLNEAGPRV